MAAKEMWDYLTATAANSTSLLDVKPQGVIVESGFKNATIHTADDNSEQRVAWSNKTVFTATLQFNLFNASDMGTVFDYYHSTALGNGITRSFRWLHGSTVGDGHTYTVRFASHPSRSISIENFHGMQNVALRILGRATS